MKKYIYIMIFALTLIGCGASDAEEQSSTDAQVSDGAIAVALPDLPMLSSNPINELEK